jgi:hypothetical protein
MLFGATESRDLSYQSTITYFNKGKNYSLKTISYITTSGPKIRVETRVGEQSLITISDGKYLYQLDTLNKIAYRQKIETITAEKNTAVGVKNYSEIIKNKSLSRIGTQTINGQTCAVYCYRDERCGVKETFWFWEAGQFPLKIETETTTEKMILENSRLSFQKIKDTSVFRVPAGYKIKDVLKNAENSEK